MAPEHSNSFNNHLKNSSNHFMSSSTSHMPYGQFQTQDVVPPPLPPRAIPSNYSGYSDYRPFGSNFYGGYGNYGYRNYGGYGGLYGNNLPFSTYNNYGQFGAYNPENRLQRYAEESTRSTFQAIEAVLHTFSSITTVLDSTYFALTNSVRAILSVADNIGQLRSTIGDLLSTLALIRFLKWIYRKALFILGIRRQNTSEEAWQQSFSQTTNGEGQTTGYTWPSLLILVAFSAIPYLIHKISSNIRNIHVQVNDPNSWLKCEDPVKVASALYDFTAASNEEMSLRTGQKIWLAPQSLQPKSTPGWWLATNSKNVGLIPANYVTVAGHLRKLKSENNKDVASLNKPQDTIPNYMQTSIIPHDKQEALCIDTLESPSFQEQDIIFSGNNTETKDNIED